ncbi:MAG: mercury methylation corrinoid protein HgcA [Pirellulales bacterium]
MSDSSENERPRRQATRNDASCRGQGFDENGTHRTGHITPWMVGSVSTPGGKVPQVNTRLTLRDRWGTWKARWGVGRMRYGIAPRLYAAGRPTDKSPVLVTANYKMSFDRLRSQLTGIDAWVLVLDTKGINVWCAAGKGTFGTDEIIHRVAAAKLEDVVSHRRLIVPQLGAPGVAAHEVKRGSGFRVLYGPVRAEDLRAFLAAGMQTTPEMRRVRFPVADRLAVAPVELMIAGRSMLLITACLFVLSGLGSDGFSWTRVATVGLGSTLLFLATCLGSIVLAPLLLPWLPGRAFAVKGAWLGFAFLLGPGIYVWNHPDRLDSWFSAAAWCLLIPTVASFLTMNYTGASTFTSLSGVRLEVRVAAPIQAACAILGATLWMVGRFT